MNRRRVFLTLFSVALLSLVLAGSGQASAQSQHTTQYKSKGLTVNTNLYGSDPLDNCISNSMTVWATKGQSVANGSTFTTSTHVDVSIYNYCTGDSLSGQADVAIPETALVINNRLQSGALNVSVDLISYPSLDTIPVTVNLTWAGSSDLYQQRNVASNSIPGCRFHNISSGTFRDAIIAGSITVGDNTFDVSSLENYNTYIANIKDSSMRVGCDF
jgi:hypothetical protein